MCLVVLGFHPLFCLGFIDCELASVGDTRVWWNFKVSARPQGLELHFKHLVI